MKKISKGKKVSVALLVAFAFLLISYKILFAANDLTSPVERAAYQTSAGTAVRQYLMAHYTGGGMPTQLSAADRRFSAQSPVQRIAVEYCDAAFPLLKHHAEAWCFHLNRAGWQCVCRNLD